MPCSYYTPQEEADMARRRYREELDRLTHENDMLREALLASVGGTEIDSEFLKSVMQSQVAHRREDLARLERTFTDMIVRGEDLPPEYEFNVYEALGRVVVAKPSSPLQEQLGFDPDDF